MTTSSTSARRVSGRVGSVRHVRSSNPPADPVFAATEAHASAAAAEVKAAMAHDRAESAARKKHGNRPQELICWRNYHVQEIELDARRAEFSKLPGIDPKKIKVEYRDACKRMRRKIARGAAWDKAAGVVGLKAACDAAFGAEADASCKMANTIPHTLAGALALLNQTRKDMEPSAIGWHERALDNVALALLEGARKHEMQITPRALRVLARHPATEGGAK